MLSRIAAPLLFVFLLLASVSSTAGPAAADGKRYICAPCGLPCDTTHFAGPGTCPACGMALVEEGSAAVKAGQDPDMKMVAILVFNGVEIVDFTGPYEMFGAAGCDVYTVAATRDPVTSAMGMTVVPKYTFADAPQPDVLVIPGGGVKAASNSEPTLAYIKAASAHATHTLSVCNGAFILANTGLLDGLSATTTNGNIPRLASQYPKIKVVRDQRYVDNGRIITAAGLSAGIDGALHVIARLFGDGQAQAVALGEEYDWHPGSGFVRGALADHEIPEVGIDHDGTWKILRTQGDRHHWNIVLDGTLSVSAAELIGHIEEALAKGRWTRVKSANPGPGLHTSTWRFTGSDGVPWTGTLNFESAGDTAHKLKAEISVSRAG